LTGARSQGEPGKPHDHEQRSHPYGYGRHVLETFTGVRFVPVMEEPGDTRR